MRLLLDTHTLIWHFEDSDSLSRNAKRAINDRDNQLFISTASIWELSIKINLGKLRLEAEVPEIIKDYTDSGTTVLCIAPEHALASGRLPWNHRDPFDRMLVAQAQLEDLAIATCDPLIKTYDVQTVW